MTVSIATGVNAIDFACLGSEGLDRCDATQVAGQVAVQQTHFFAHFAVTRRQLLLKQDRAPQDERHRQHAHPSDLGRDPKEHRADRQHRGRDLQQLVRANIQEALQLVDVVIQDRHQATRRAILEIGQLHFLHLGIGLEAQLVLQILGEVAPAQLVKILEQRFEGPDQKSQA